MNTINFKDLPAVGAALNSGIFAGVITRNSAHVAVVLLYGRGESLTWAKANEWAKNQGGELPTRQVAALLLDNCKDNLPTDWLWTNADANKSLAWVCSIRFNTPYLHYKGREIAAVAVKYLEVI